MAKKKPETKLVDVSLAALTRVVWCGTVEVPVDMDDDEVIQHVYDSVDGDEYTDDTDFWERGTCEVDGISVSLKPHLKVDSEGHVTSVSKPDRDAPV